MLLTDGEIAERCLDTHAPLLDPFVDRQVRRVDDRPIISYGLSSCGYDLRASDQWKLFHNMTGKIVDPKRFDPRLVFDGVVLEDGGVIIPPNSYALTSSVERFIMPHDLLGVCIGKSTYARAGIHVNVTPIEPGWCGYLTIEISNATNSPVKVYSGEGICQVMFHHCHRVVRAYNDSRKYQGQSKTPGLPKV